MLFGNRPGERPVTTRLAPSTTFVRCYDCLNATGIPVHFGETMEASVENFIEIIRDRYWPEFPAGDTPEKRAEARLQIFMDLFELEAPEFMQDYNWRNEYVVNERVPEWWQSVADRVLQTVDEVILKAPEPGAILP